MRTRRIKTMADRAVSFLRVLLALILILLCLAAAGGAAAAYEVPKLAASKFGPPGSSLSITQRLIYSTRLMANQNALLSPLDPKGEPRDFSVPYGETVNSIATRLEEERFIASADSFRTYLIYAGLDKGVQAGKYTLSPAMPAVLIARSLQDAVPTEVEFHILPGWRAEEIAASLPMSGLSVSPDEFLRIVHNPPDSIFPAGFPMVGSLEGFLMPGQYEIKREITAPDLAALFVRRFDTDVPKNLREAFTRGGFTLEQAVTLASIIQREAVLVDEQPVIASVFFNRLANGMKLESDPTAQYAVGYVFSKQTWWKNPLTIDDLQIDSRYNTYIYPGLPPGPICSPGVDALRAVANPAQTDYFYFRAKCDGSGHHSFSKTYEEHLQNGCP